MTEFISFIVSLILMFIIIFPFFDLIFCIIDFLIYKFGKKEDDDSEN